MMRGKKLRPGDWAELGEAKVTVAGR
jgi:ribosome-associated protein YbcJ (S4-like RNA binding protein)